MKKALRPWEIEKVNGKGRWGRTVEETLTLGLDRRGNINVGVGP